MFFPLIYLLLLENKVAGYNLNQSFFYAGLAGTLADYFDSACLYFFTDSRNDDTIFLEHVMKEVSLVYKQSTNVYSFKEYHTSMATDPMFQCYVPLQVVISHDDATREAFAKHSQSSSMHGTDSHGGGVWLVFIQSIEEDYLEEYFREIHTPFDVELIVAELWHGEEMRLKEVYRVSKGMPLRMPEFGKWSRKYGLKAPNKSLLYSRRSNLENITLQVGYVDSQPFSYLGDDGELTGFMSDIWKIVEEKINVTSAYKKVNAYGIFHSNNNSWDGMIGDMQKNKFDIGIADMTLTQKRFEVLSYSVPLLVTVFQVYYQSSGSAVDADALFLPLADDMWATLLGWIFIAAMFLYLGCYLSDKELRTTERLSFMQSIFFVAGALCAQGGVNIPRRYTCRALFIASFMITSVVIPSYSASLMSFLTVLTPSVPFTTMKEFFETGTIRLNVKYGSYEYDLFAYETSTDPYMMEIFKRDLKDLEESQFPTTNRAGIQKVCKDKSQAFFGHSDAVDWAMRLDERAEGRRRTCIVASMPLASGKLSLGLVFPKRSHLRGLVNHELAALPMTGLLKGLRWKYWPMLKGKLLSDDIQPVGINNIFMSLVIWGGGVLLAVIFFLVELYLASRRPKTAPVLCPKALKRELTVSQVYNHWLSNTKRGGVFYHY